MSFGSFFPPAAAAPWFKENGSNPVPALAGGSALGAAIMAGAGWNKFYAG